MQVPIRCKKANNPLARLIKQQQDAAICKEIRQKSPHAHECDLCTRSNYICQGESESTAPSLDLSHLREVDKVPAYGYTVNGWAFERPPQGSGFDTATLA